MKPVVEEKGAGDPESAQGLPVAGGCGQLGKKRAPLREAVFGNLREPLAVCLRRCRPEGDRHKAVATVLLHDQDGL